MTQDPGAALAAIEAERSRQRAAWRQSGQHRGRNLVEVLHERLADREDTVLRFLATGHEGEITIGRLYEEGARTATALTEIGVRPGARIALHVPNWPEAMSALYAALLLRAVVVPIPSIYGPAEVRFILDDARVDTYVLADRWRSQVYTDSLPQVTGAAALERVIVVGDTVPPGTLAWSEVAERARRVEPMPLAARHIDSQSNCFVIYTSGSTANPKGGQHSHDTFAAEFAQNRAALAQPGRYLQAFPGGHVAGLLGMLRPLLFGHETIVMDHWDADLAATVTDELGVTAIVGAPFYLATLLDAADRLGKSLRTIEDMLVGSAAVPPALVERAEAAGFRPYRCYGSTEHPTVSSNVPADSLEDRSRTDGALLAGVEVKIVDEDGRSIPAGGAGEILTRGPDQFIGYTDARASAAVFTPGGWFRTGDVGFLTPGGRLVISDRKKDVIIRGGENLSSQEIEGILVRHPAVSQAAVVGLPDERYGERACAVVVLRPGRDLSLATVREHFVAAGVARQKTPEMLVVRPELPRTAAGKVKKFLLREQIGAF
ncbi:MAG TPA: AMP-binding protein, partial [Streptosporangiaceae bacterium]|nr:AMP-binding protein [Streptosporangiaceae bacterium]